VIRAGLEESSPGKAAFHKNVRPEGSGRGVEIERQFPGREDAANVIQEATVPRFELDQKAQRQSTVDPWLWRYLIFGELVGTGDVVHLLYGRGASQF
jgi:hypothetical protein